MDSCPSDECDGEVEYSYFADMAVAEVWYWDSCKTEWFVPLIRDFENVQEV